MSRARERWLRSYEAFLILRAAGYGAKRIRKILEELVKHGSLDSEVPSASTLNHWCYRGNVPEVTSPLI